MFRLYLDDQILRKTSLELDDKNFTSFEKDRIWHYRGHTNNNSETVIEIGPGLRKFTLLANHCTKVGQLFGFPIDRQNKRLLTESSNLTIGDELSTIDAIASEIYERFSGKYVFYLEYDKRSRLYLDCGGQIPCVFSGSEKRFGVSADAILSQKDYADRFRIELYDSLAIEQYGWFPGEDTLHEGVERLLPNHFLDLKTYKSYRHYSPPAASLSDNLHETIAEICEEIALQLECLSRSEKQLLQTVTAGRDSRAILGCSESTKKKTVFITIKNNIGRNIDVTVANKIMKIFGAEHVIVEKIEPTLKEKTTYMRCNGHCVADANLHQFPSLKRFNDSYNLVGGAYGEVGAGYYWSEEDKKKKTITPEEILEALDIPKTDETICSVSKWLSKIVVKDRRETLTLAYLELRMGCWAAPQFASNPGLEKYYPFVSRVMFERLWALPEEIRETNAISEEILRMQMPQLLSVKFNSLGIFSELLHLLVKGFKQPKLIKKRIAAEWKRITNN